MATLLSDVKWTHGAADCQGNADPLLHSSTFAGSPLAAAAVTATIGAIKAEGLIQRTRELGPQVRALAADAVTAHCPHLVTEVRGEGLLLGLRCVVPNGQLVDALREERLLAVGAGDNVVRLVPPLVVTEAEVGDAMGMLDRACARLVRAAEPAQQGAAG